MICVFKKVFTLMFVLGIGTFTFVSCSSSEVADDEAASAAAKATPPESQAEDGGRGHEKTELVSAESEAELDWCLEHSVPESVCTICNPSLIAGYKDSGDWCIGHDIPESHCRLCNPEIVFPQEEILRSRALAASGARAELDWCLGHAVPESECTICNPSLIAGYKESGDWCIGHDIPESQCRLCNPEIVFPQEEILQSRALAASGAEAELDWCLEHAVPESECTICNPSLIAEFKESGDWCIGHDIPESQCRLCNPEIVFPQENILRDQKLAESENDIEVSLFFRPNAEICATDGALIQFASSLTTERAGITVQRAYQSHFEATVDAPAEVVFDETQKYIVTSTVPALISRWFVSPGDVVEKGSPLAILQSPEISTLKSSLVSAHVNYEVERKELERHKQMQKQNLISEADFDQQYARSEQARVALVSARGLLLAAGLGAGDIDEVIKHGDVSNRFALTAPSTGIVAERIAQLGELLNPGSAFAMLADPTSMWIEASLSEEQLRTIDVGQTLSFSSDGRGLGRVGAEVIWVSRFLDPHTRTGTVRARVLNPNHQLQAGEFGRVKIVQGGDSDVAVVPKDAVQWEGCCNVVFVKETDQRFRPRKVQFLNGEGPTYQVTSGLAAGEEIVVGGAFLLKTELKKSSIGAGCCSIEPAG